MFDLALIVKGEWSLFICVCYFLHPSDKTSERSNLDEKECLLAHVLWGIQTIAVWWALWWRSWADQEVER